VADGDDVVEEGKGGVTESVGGTALPLLPPLFLISVSTLGMLEPCLLVLRLMWRLCAPVFWGVQEPTVAVTLTPNRAIHEVGDER
jgi:hypothetical protein